MDNTARQKSLFTVEGTTLSYNVHKCPRDPHGPITALALLTLHGNPKASAFGWLKRSDSLVSCAL